MGIVPPWVLALFFAAAVVLSGLAAASLPGDLSTVSRYAYASPCAEGQPSSDCLAELPGQTTARIDRRSTSAPQHGGSTSTAVIHVSVPDAPPDTVLFQGNVVVQISPGQADRLGISGAGHDVTVMLFGGRAVEITGPNGTSSAVEETPVERAAGMFAMTMAFAAFGLVLGVYLIRRMAQYGWNRTSPTGLLVAMPRWVIPVSATLPVGAVLGALIGWLSARFVSVSLMLPVMLGIFVLVAGGGVIGWLRRRTPTNS
ncbi:hypothetical protein [Phytoactinopolyspora mesophila]|uniref:Uncharacterized protein n=1 Tax=Phytoactinopolyspora mesophila TaxID=2650750 RepID=A0A7K3M317_9ACTN|nr:hypothetical protein [Phytoactinopolyspora mesophila]NDL57711.1 hypothetical protein [Phytoactinopolyspora mesophila]